MPAGRPRKEISRSEFEKLCKLQCTQQESGGMTEMYLDGGTYKKSFYSVMYAPSCVSIRVMGETHRRIYHRVDWEHCSPMILQERWKKKRAEV